MKQYRTSIRTLLLLALLECSNSPWIHLALAGYDDEINSSPAVSTPASSSQAHSLNPLVSPLLLQIKALQAPQLRKTRTIEILDEIALLILDQEDITDELSQIQIKLHNLGSMPDYPTDEEEEMIQKLKETRNELQNEIDEVKNRITTLTAEKDKIEAKKR